METKYKIYDAANVLVDIVTDDLRRVRHMCGLTAGQTSQLFRRGHVRTESFTVAKYR